MAKMIFVNLPVSDVARSTAFYEALGFTKDQRFSNDQASAMTWSDAISVMLLAHDFYRTFLPEDRAIATGAVSEVLLCLSFDDRAGVDAITEAAERNGGTADIRAPQDMGFMYSRAFADPDGHIFEPMHMDVAAALAAMNGADEPVAA